MGTTHKTNLSTSDVGFAPVNLDRVTASCLVTLTNIETCVPHVFNMMEELRKETPPPAVPEALGKKLWETISVTVTRKYPHTPKVTQFKITKIENIGK